MRKFLIIGGGIVSIVILVAIGAIIYVYSNLEDLVKTAVEEVGSEATQTKVTLNEAEISLKTAKAALRGLSVGNPSGYKTDSAFVLGEVSITIDASSINANPKIIQEVVIAAPQVTYEIGEGGSNIDVIRRNVQAYADRFGGGKTPAPEDSAGEEVKLIIENLYVRDGNVNVSAPFLQGRRVGTPLPAIHLTDIGKDKGGASPAEVAEKLIASMSQSAVKAVSSLDLDGLRKGAEDAIKGMSEGVGGAAGGAAKGAGDALKGVTEGAGDAAKKLFGK